MNFEQIFGQAKWIGAPEGSGYVTVRDYFEAKDDEKAEITILGFGRFVLFINGKRAHDDYFLPLNAYFENAESYSPYQDFLFGTRAYPCKFDISHLVHEGKNSIAVMLGGGWYTGSHIYAGKTQGYFGFPKLCYKINVGEEIHYSSTTAKYSKYFVVESAYNAGETYDFENCGMEITDENYDDSAWENCVPAKPLETDLYAFSDCPTDKLIRHIKPTLNDKGVYDAGVNLTGFPVLISGGGDVEVVVSEEINPDGTLDEVHTDWQFLRFKNTKKGQRLAPLFTWLGFRCFKIIGNAEVECVEQIHADVKITSTFDCDNEILNWTYKTFLHTMLSNMHEGQPSDCPQIERRGYTGDGQVTAPAVFRTLGAREFYRKWIDDISDCQDRNTGHVQNTAPFTKSGGGPGGWGIAIVKVPYEFMKSFGDEEPARKLYPQMLHYFEFMESQSDFGLVTRTIPENAWCLGDWCPPEVKIKIPPALVNTYFYVKAMEMVIEMANRFGHEEDIPTLRERIDRCKKAITAAYFDKRDGQFVGNVQGATAFAMDIGLGNEKTASEFIKHYEKADAFDTGIFGTEIVIRMLFELGRGDLAVKLITAEEPHGFGYWKKQGATTFWEYWTKPSRSLSHPMFGGCVSSFFDYILGIKQDENSIGYQSITIKPADIPSLSRVAGSIATPYGTLSVSYTRTQDGIDLQVSAPDGITVNK